MTRRKKLMNATVFLHLHNEKSNIDRSSKNTQYVNDTLSVILSAYNIDVYIFLHVLIITVVRSTLRTVNPDFGRSTGKITRIILHVR